MTTHFVVTLVVTLSSITYKTIHAKYLPFNICSIFNCIASNESLNCFPSFKPVRLGEAHKGVERFLLEMKINYDVTY